MADLPTQISSAISVALNPSPDVAQEQRDQRHTAYVFLQQVKDAKEETWQACLNMSLEEVADGNARKKKYTSEERLFACQVVGDSLPLLALEGHQFILSRLMQYFAEEFVNGAAENGVIYLKNAFVHLAALLFLHVYPSASANFFESFVSMLRVHSIPAESSNSGVPSNALNSQTTDLLLRLLHEISTEISDAQLRLNKDVVRLTRDTELRDAIRTKDAPLIASTLWQIIDEALEGVTKVEEGTKMGLRGKTARDVVIMAIRVAGDFVSWIDINLMITPTSIPLLLKALNLPSRVDLAICSATAETLLETVLKGTNCTDKIALLHVLNVKVVLNRLIDVHNGDDGDSNISDFKVRLARLLNGVGTELCKILEDTNTLPECMRTGSEMLVDILPLLLRLISDPSDSITDAVFGFSNAVVALYKKEKKRSVVDPSVAVSAEKKLLLQALLKATVEKSRYKANVTWTLVTEGDEDEEAIEFVEMRKKLRVVGDAVASIDQDIYGDTVRTTIVDTLDRYQVDSVAVRWQDLDLALYLLYGYGQAITTAGSNSTGPGAFVNVPQGDSLRARKEADFQINYTRYPLSHLGEMMLRANQSRVVAYAHPAVSLQFFEVVVRYHEFFKLCPEFVGDLLPNFMDQHGLHQTDEAVQARVFYLFSRFIYQAKTVIQVQVSAEFISGVLSQLEDLLNIEAEIPTDEPPSEALLTKAASLSTMFDSQLYLFESIGTLISILNQTPDQQVTLLRAVISPLLVGLQEHSRVSVATHEDLKEILLVHHHIMAVGNVAKGFPDLSSRTPNPKGPWANTFVEATQGVLTAAKALGNHTVIRDAARFAFNRIVATTGEAILPLIPALIDCLIGQITFPELADLLSFLGLLVAKFRGSFKEILNALLLPVFNRVFHFLEFPISGTDDVIQHSALRRAYFSFILSILAAGVQEVFFSELNRPHFEDVLKSVTHYIANDSLAPDQRFGFIVLNKFLSLWGRSYSSAGDLPEAEQATPSPVPGFEQFLYNNAVRLCFEVPLKPDFDFGDAGSYQVIGEICNLLKGLEQKRSSEFIDFMVTKLFPSIQCPPSASQAFIQALKEAADGKQFKKFASEWLRQSRAVSR